jgi:hypothetical protein
MGVTNIFSEQSEDVFMGRALNAVNVTIEDGIGEDGLAEPFNWNGEVLTLTLTLNSFIRPLFLNCFGRSSTTLRPACLQSLQLVVFAPTKTANGRIEGLVLEICTDISRGRGFLLILIAPQALHIT